MIQVDTRETPSGVHPGVIYSPGSRAEISTVIDMTQLQCDASPELGQTNRPLWGANVFHRSPRSVGNVILESLKGIEDQDPKNGTPLPSIKFTYDEAKFLQVAARSVRRFKKYQDVAKEILAVNLQRAA